MNYTHTNVEKVGSMSELLSLPPQMYTYCFSTPEQCPLATYGLPQPHYQSMETDHDWDTPITVYAL